MAPVPGDTLDWLELTDALLHALDNADIGMTITIQDGDQPRYLHHNAAAAAILGVESQELLNRDPRSFLAPDELERFLALWDEPTPPPRHTETWVVRGDGRRVPLELGLAPATYRGRSATVVFFRDISSRIEAEQALRTSEARFRQLAEASPDSITVVSGGQFLYANPATAQLLGFDSVEELLDRPFELLLDEEDRALMWQRIERVRSGERLTPIEYHPRRKDGTFITMELSSIVTEFEGQPAILGYGRDVSQRHRLQAELIQSERMAAVGTLAAGVAHEINNPLTYVMLRLQGLRRSLVTLIPDAGARAGIERQLDDVVEGSHRVADIVRNLLSFARTDHDEPEATEVEPVIDSAAKLAATALRDRVRLERDFGDVGAVHGGPSQLGQVFLNLLINAAQAFEDDSPGRNVIQVRTRRDGEQVVVEVADNGPGIPRDHRERIFEPFFTTKGRRGGTGLGLAITRSVVDSLGGSIGIADGIDGGARFLVTLPGAPQRIMVPASPAPTCSARARILIIDDEVLICSALASALEGDHQVTVETDSRAALERLCRDPLYDVVFCDLSMPELTGPDLYERLCAERPDYAGRFVFITGGATSPRAATFLETTTAMVIPKPFTSTSIAEAVERLMSKLASKYAD